MALEDQINKVDCGAAGVLGTGTEGCQIDQDRVEALGLLPKGFKFTEEITLDYLRELQQEGKLIMLQGVVSYTDATADNNIITREGTGIKKKTGTNPYEKVVTFDNGINFATALTYLDSYNQYDIIEFDKNNTIWMTRTKANEPKGFTLGMFDPGKYMGANGVDASSKTVTFQKIRRDEWDKYVTFVTNEQWDGSYDELQGVNEVKVTVDPISAGTSIAVSAFLLDGTHPVEGLLFGNFTVTKNGVASNPTVEVYSSTTKKYTLTVPTLVATDVVTVSLNGIILTTLGTLYKSNTAKAVVI